MSPLLEAGINLTAIGMGVVFVLLGLLVGVIRVMSALAAWIESLMPAPPQGTSATPPPASGNQIISVIGAAIAAHRKHR